MSEYEVDQRVVVTGTIHSHREKVQYGKITRVGRTLVDVVTDDNPWRTDQYRQDGQVINDDYGHSRFYTLEQWSLRQQRLAALAVLEEFGLEPVMGRRLDTGHLIEIADLVKGF